MAKKRNIKNSLKKYEGHIKVLQNLTNSASKMASVTKKSKDRNESWLHEMILLQGVTEFERLCEYILIGLLSKKTKQFAELTGLRLPDSISDDMAEAILVRDGYFDFRSVGNLVDYEKKFIVEGERLFSKLDTEQRGDLDLILALRNYIVHSSKKSKKSLKNILNKCRNSNLKTQNVPVVAGAWLKAKPQGKSENRMTLILNILKQAAKRLRSS